MSNLHLNFGRRKTLGIEPKNEEKVFIKIPLESGGFWEREYLQNDLIGTVINDFKEENHVDIPKDYFMDWNCKNKSLKMTDKIRTLIAPQIPTICFNAEIKKNPLEVKEKDIIPQLVAKPFNNPFEIFLFKKSDKLLKIQTYDDNIIENLGLNDYSPSSAYCNGNNQLFISGGKTKNNEIINKLWQIDLENNNINDPIEIPPKKNHSMIFIPPGYVFVVGGNDKKTFYLDSEKKEVYEWADLNNERNEPALERVGNTLYCFENVNKTNNEQLTFEKTELNSKNPKWNLLYPKLDQSLLNEKLPQKFFGVSKDLEDNIIFIGGNMDYNNNENKLINYKYNPKENIILPSNIPYKDFNFKEKTFLTYNKNINYILPDFNRQHPEVIFYVKNKSKVEKVNYKPNTNSNRKNILRGAKRTLMDSKYDFNMPSITIPNPSIENLNENIKLKSEPQKQNYISPYATIDIHEPSFHEYDYNLNYKIEQPPSFKEPAIEANMGDQRLSIDIPNDIIESSRTLKKESEKKELELKMNIKEEEKNEGDYKKEKIKLKYIPRPGIDYNRKLYTQIPMYNNELTIPKFHYSVNDPGNELNITSKGKVYTSYIPRDPVRIKASHADFNIKSSRLEKDDLILPNYNYSVNVDVDKEFRGISPENLGMSARNAKYNGNIDGEILTPNIHMPQSQGFNLNAVNINSPDYKLNGQLPGIDIKGSSGYKLSGQLPEIDAKVPNINIGRKNDDDFKLEGIIPGIKGGINLKEGKAKIPDYSLSGKIPGANVNSPKINLKNPNLNLKGPDFNISGNIPGNKIEGPNIDLLNPNIELKGPKIDLKGPKIKEPDFNLKGNIEGVQLNSPKIDIKGPDYNLNGSIEGIKIDTPKIDMPGKINLKGPKINTDYNIEGSIPGINENIDIQKPKININKPKINSDYNLTGIIPGIKKSSSTIDIKGQRRLPDYNLNAKGPDINLKSSRFHMPSPEIDIKGSRRMLNNDDNLKGVIPGINLKNSNINLPSGNIDIKGPNINRPDYNLSGNIPGMKINSPNIDIKGPNIKGPDYNLSGNIPGMKINSPNIDLKGPNINPDLKLEGNLPEVKLNSPNIDIKGPNINRPDYNLSGYIPGMKINAPKVDIKSPNVDLKGPNINPDLKLEGNLPGVKLNSPNIDIKGPNINGPDYNLSGYIPGVKINAPKVDIKSPNVDIKGPGYNIDGEIPGVDIKASKLDIPSGKINLKSPNLNVKAPKLPIPDFNMSGIIEGNKSYRKNLNIKSPNINIKGPNIANPEYSLKGEIPGMKINSPNIDLKGPNINHDLKLEGNLPGVKLNSPNIDIKGPNINGPDYNLSGNIPGVKINSPNIDLKGPNVDLKGPKINPDLKLEGNLPGVKLNSPNINIKGPNINGPDYNLKGDIPGMKINVPKVDIKSPTVDLKGPDSDYNLKGNIPGINIKVPNLKGPNYKLEGIIPGISSKNKDYSLSGVIHSSRNFNPNIDIQNQDSNIKTSFNPNLKVSVNSNRRISPGKKNFHGGLNDPNYLDFSDIKGSRRPLFSSQIEDVDLTKKINKNKFNVSGNKIIDEQDVILQEPFNINNQILLQNQNPGNRKSIHLVVSQLQIQPEDGYNLIQPSKANIDIKPPELELNNKDIDTNKIDIKGGEFELKMDNENNIVNNIGNSGNIGIKFNDEKNNDINIRMPKIEIKNDINLKQDIPKIEINDEINIKEEIPNIGIKQPNLKAKINLKKKEPTNLRFKPINDEDDLDNIKKDEESYSDSNSKEEVSNSKGMISEKLNSPRRKGKGLPLVGVKSNNFKSSKIDVAGKLNVENIDVDNLKSANVGVNGVKLGERIIE